MPERPHVLQAPGHGGHLQGQARDARHFVSRDGRCAADGLVGGAGACDSIASAALVTIASHGLNDLLTPSRRLVWSVEVRGIGSEPLMLWVKLTRSPSVSHVPLTGEHIGSCQSDRATAVILFLPLNLGGGVFFFWMGGPRGVGPSLHGDDDRAGWMDGRSCLLSGKSRTLSVFAMVWGKEPLGQLGQ